MGTKNLFSNFVEEGFHLIFPKSFRKFYAFSVILIGVHCISEIKLINPSPMLKEIPVLEFFLTVIFWLSSFYIFFCIFILLESVSYSFKTRNYIGAIIVSNILFLLLFLKYSFKHIVFRSTLLFAIFSLLSIMFLIPILGLLIEFLLRKEIFINPQYFFEKDSNNFLCLITYFSLLGIFFFCFIKFAFLCFHYEPSVLVAVLTKSGE